MLPEAGKPRPQVVISQSLAAEQEVDRPDPGDRTDRDLEVAGPVHAEEGRVGLDPAFDHVDARYRELLAIVRDLDDAPVDDVTKGIRLIMAAARRSVAPPRKPTARRR